MVCGTTSGSVQSGTKICFVCVTLYLYCVLSIGYVTLYLYCVLCIVYVTLYLYCVLCFVYVTVLLLPNLESIVLVA